jgi:hypothetical protein
MANQTDRPMEGERYAPKHPRDYPALPYYPRLGRALGGVTISIVVCYLEIHHPAPAPDFTAPPRLRNPPVYLDCDQACEDLGVSGRTLDIALCGVAVWWRGEQERSAAARSGRDFIKPNPSFHVRTHARIRPYAIVGSRSYSHPRTIAIHRNFPRLAQILIDAGIIPISQAPIDCTHLSQTYTSGRSALSVSSVLESAIGLVPARRGIAWGWSPERKMAHSMRMAELWAERRKSPKK